MAKYSSLHISRSKDGEWHVTGDAGVTVVSYKCNNTACDCEGTGWVITGNPKVTADDMFTVEGEGPEVKLVWCNKGTTKTFQLP